MNTPLVSVVTPTWQRREQLLSRCVPSVQKQDYPAVEHVVVSDGPDEALTFWMTKQHPEISYYELPDHHPEPNLGHYARLYGVEHATGEYITYNDDDDELRPEHCRLLAAALDEHPEAGFAVSRMVSHNGDSATIIGYGPLVCCNVGSPMIMHRRSILQYGTWGPASRLEDWEVVAKWLNAGISYVRVNAETADVWPYHLG